MTKFKFLILALLAVQISAAAQQDPKLDEAIAAAKADITLTYGCNDLVHTDNRTFTKAPKGYESFYVWHYNRHGSRYAWNKKTYSLIPVVLQNEKDNLTEYGKDLLERMIPFCQKCLPYYGELTQKGWEQHRQIAYQLFDAEKDIFKRNPYIDASSSSSSRAIMSEASFCLALKECNKNLDIHAKLTKKSELECNLNWDEKNLPGPFPCWQPDKALFMKHLLNPDDVLGKIFVNIPEQFAEWNKFDFLLELWIFATGTDSLDFEADFSDIFSDDQKIAMARYESFCAYIDGCESLYNYTRIVSSVIETAEACINNPRPYVKLRFGHDYVLVRILRLIGAGNFALEPLTPESTFYITPLSEIPMGANVRLTFYRPKNGDGDILVKCTLNGRETTLPFEPVCGPFYKYEDLKNRILAYPKP